ncbi:hypothetical protein ACLG6S_15480 [Thermodesulfobacteriota bacterium B35]
MSAATRAAEALIARLGEKDGYTHVQRLVRSRAIQQIRGSALAVYLGHRFGPAPDGLAEELAHEFVRYLLEKFLPRLGEHPDLVTAMLNGQSNKVLGRALDHFLLQLRDTARRKASNPRAYLYRCARQVLRQDSGFILTDDGRNYLPADVHGEPIQDPAAFAGLEYGRWSVPPDPGNMDALFSAAYLVTAARFFHRLSSGRLGATVMVPVRELVRYLAAHHAWLDRLQPLQLTDDLPLAAAVSDVEEQVSRTLARPAIAALAVQFAMGMDETARRVFFWRLGDPPLPFREIAERLGLPDHNRTYRIYSQTEKALRNFVSHWSGPPLDELPDDVGLTFIEELRKICKKSLS